MSDEIDGIIAKMTTAQRQALIDAATLLDHFAGEGAGMMPREMGGDKIFADDVVCDLAEAFGIEMGDDFGKAVRSRLSSMEASNG